MVNSEFKLFVQMHEGKPAYEMVPSEQIGPNRYRLLGSPGFATGVASGDEVEYAPSEISGFRVVKRSGNICIQMFLSKCTPEEREIIVDIVRAIGGWLDGGKDHPGAGSVLIFNIPVSKGFPVIEDAMNRISKSFAVSSWMYGNVYSTKDGKTPLNWWQKSS